MYESARRFVANGMAGKRVGFKQQGQPSGGRLLLWWSAEEVS